jgi:cytoskeletal protein CcmA (bactofilin family)
MQVGFGPTVVVKGEVRASEDLVILGRLEGSIALSGHLLTVLDGAEVQASIVAKSVISLGNIVGNVEALERVELREGSALSGDITAPRIAIAEGAFVNGTIEMPKRS